ncbi:hypothetical protein K438DRAFT_1768094 [Mycena galopus ATCC 62051]|nr:hypothetical protein K438DRAFT_1768094 [Mycena galopus ATCC 62051]
MTDPRYYSHLSGTNTVPRSSYSSLENAGMLDPNPRPRAKARCTRKLHQTMGIPLHGRTTVTMAHRPMPPTPPARSIPPPSYSSPTPSYNTTQYPASYPFGVAPGPYATQFTTGPTPDLCTSIKQCYNCGTTSTPLWRRDPAMQHILCNACGLYQQLRCEARPQVLIDAYNNEGEEEPPPIRADGPQCSECGTRKTSVWRRNKHGEQVCNACGVYYRVNGRPRPLTMPQSKVKPRAARSRSSLEMIP